MLAGADHKPVEGSAGRVWIAPISLSSLSNVTVGSTPCRTVRNLVLTGSLGQQQTQGSNNALTCLLTHSLFARCSVHTPTPSFFSNHVSQYLSTRTTRHLHMQATLPAHTGRRVHDTNSGHSLVVTVPVADAPISGSCSRNCVCAFAVPFFRGHVVSNHASRVCDRLSTVTLLSKTKKRAAASKRKLHYSCHGGPSIHTSVQSAPGGLQRRTTSPATRPPFLP